jgi:polar amino acid transport system permease protein
MIWDQGFALSILPQLLEGLAVTLQVTLAGFAIAATLGLAIAILRRARVPGLSRVLDGYVQFVRGTPLLVQAYTAFFVLPAYGLRLSALATGVLVMGVNYSAYCAEVYRAGIEDVPSGQWEAATALSLPPTTTWGRVVLPQAVRSVVPVLGNYLVQMFKDSAVLAAITVFELLNAAQSIGSSSFRYLEPLTLAGLLFFLVSFPASHLFRTLERRLAPTR